jgi:hypothetical protein
VQYWSHLVEEAAVSARFTVARLAALRARGGALLVAGLGLGWPLLAAADEARDPAEIGHAFILVGVLALLFIGAFALGIWLIVARLASDKEEAALAGRSPNFERIWFPGESPPKAPPLE